MTVDVDGVSLCSARQNFTFGLLCCFCKIHTVAYTTSIWISHFGHLGNPSPFALVLSFFTYNHARRAIGICPLIIIVCPLLLTHATNPKDSPVLYTLPLPSVDPLIRFESRGDLFGRHAIERNPAPHRIRAAQRRVVRPVPMPASAEEASLAEDSLRHDGLLEPALLLRREREGRLLDLEAVLAKRRELQHPPSRGCS